MNAPAASKEQTPTMSLWNDSSAKKLKPIAGKKPTTKGIAAQWMAQATEATTPIESVQILDLFITLARMNVCHDLSRA